MRPILAIPCLVLAAAFVPGVADDDAAGRSRVYIAGVGGVSMPEVEGSRIQPDYPEKARLSKLTGLVVLQAIVRADGSCEVDEVLNSSTPDQGFEESAIEAVEQWRYKPAIRQGEPVDAYLTIKVDFKLDDGTSGASLCAPPREAIAAKS